MKFYEDANNEIREFFKKYLKTEQDNKIFFLIVFSVLFTVLIGLTFFVIRKIHYMEEILDYSLISEFEDDLDDKSDSHVSDDDFADKQ